MKKDIINKLNILFKNSSKILKKFIHKGIIAVSIILLLLLLKTINTKPTNKLLEGVKNTLYYEFSVVDDSRRIFNRGKDLLDDSQRLLEVFNLGIVDKYSAPIEGEVHKEFHKETNKGIDIRSDEDHEPRVILDGIVKDVVLTDNKGYYVTVESEDISHVYGYLSKSYVVIGDTVSSGDLIGYLGTNRDGEKYLRFELIKDGKHVNPKNYIEIK